METSPPWSMVDGPTVFQGFTSLHFRALSTSSPPPLVNPGQACTTMLYSTMPYTSFYFLSLLVEDFRRASTRFALACTSLMLMRRFEPPAEPTGTVNIVFFLREDARVLFRLPRFRLLRRLGSFVPGSVVVFRWWW